MNIFFDCETTYTDLQWVKDEIEVSPPATYKKQESIDKWMSENAERVKQERIAKTALDTSLARIICIGFAIDDGDIQTLTGPEDEILAAFFSSISGRTLPTLIGHNILGYDIPLVYHRAIINGIRPHGAFHMHHKPWYGNNFDTMTEWAGMRDRISLDRLCKLLGIPGKGDIDGSMVPEMYERGEIDKIAEYCAHDVEKVRAIYRRLTGTHDAFVNVA